MFDKEQFRKEIEAQIKVLPHDKQFAFAIRSVMRVLPLLSAKKMILRKEGVNKSV